MFPYTYDSADYDESPLRAGVIGHLGEPLSAEEGASEPDSVDGSVEAAVLGAVPLAVVPRRSNPVRAGGDEVSPTVHKHPPCEDKMFSSVT